MKITIDIDCTPQEARSFLGLPNVEPMQEALVQQMQERLSHYLDATDPDTLLRTWFPSGLKGLGQLQEQFWSQLMSGMAGPEKDGPKGKKAKG
jgi:hypothetical protein